MDQRHDQIQTFFPLTGLHEVCRHHYRMDQEGLPSINNKANYIFIYRTVFYTCQTNKCKIKSHRNKIV